MCFSTRPGQSGDRSKRGASEDGYGQPDVIPARSRLRGNNPSISHNAGGPFRRLTPAYVIVYKTFTSVSKYEVRTFTFADRTFIICARPHPYPLLFHFCRHLPFRRRHLVPDRGQILL